MKGPSSDCSNAPSSGTRATEPHHGQKSSRPGPDENSPPSRWMAVPTAGRANACRTPGPCAPTAPAAHAPGAPSAPTPAAATSCAWRARVNSTGTPPACAGVGPRARRLAALALAHGCTLRLVNASRGADTAPTASPVPDAVAKHRGPSRAARGPDSDAGSDSARMERSSFPRQMGVCCAPRWEVPAGRT